MNLIKQLSDELSQLHLNDFEKARYIYLRCCEIFSFDSRYWFTDLLDDFKLRNEIISKKLYLGDIEDRLIVCYSFSKYILKPLIDNLTNLNCNIINRGNHTLVLLDYKYREWELDATFQDLARVKLGIQTEGFKVIGDNNSNISLIEIDSGLGFKTMTLEQFRQNNSISFDNYTEYLQHVGKILKESKVKNYYSDAVFLVDDVMGAYLYSEDKCTYVDKDYKFHRLFDLTGEYSYFDLCKDDNEYVLKKIRPCEYNDLKSRLKNK